MPREKKLSKQLFNSIWGASNQIKSKRIESNEIQTESDNKTQRVSATNNHHRGVPHLFPILYSTLSAVSDVGVALGMQIMSNVTTNSTQDAAATRLWQRGWFRFKNFLLLLCMRRQEEGGERRETGYLLPDLRHWLVAEPFRNRMQAQTITHIPPLSRSSPPFLPALPWGPLFTPPSRGTRLNWIVPFRALFGQLQ